MTDQAPNGRPVKPLIMLGLIIGSVLVVYVSPLHDLLLPEGRESLSETIAGLGWWAWLAFIGASALSISVGAPRLAFAILGGVLFGWLWGFLLAHTGTVLGCMGAFSWSRWLGRDYVSARMARRRGRLLKRVQAHPIATNVLIRVCPVGNNFATNMLFGVSQVTARQFFIGTFIGTSVETLIYAIFGSSAESADKLKLLVGGGLLALMTVGFYVASRRSKVAADAMAIGEQLADDSGPEDAEEAAGPDSGEAVPPVAPGGEQAADDRE
jgi:uncharacterized membrane protein YdjX (TVP38/TMEM64 family)